jgi:glutamine---fructose-6-phosphate transaminase (isomerizing)
LIEFTETAGANTLAEILSQPETWAKCLEPLGQSRLSDRLRSALVPGRDRIFVGCGSSYYLALAAAATWSIVTGEPARAVPASELVLFPKAFLEDFSAVLISRSGRTSEVIEAGRYLKRQNRTAALAITCGTGTPIEDLAQEVIRLPDADEKSTVMTRSFTSMLLALQLLAAQQAAATEFSAGIRALAREMEPHITTIDATIRGLVHSHAFEDYVFLGQGPFFGVAQEAMLKVTEMSCSYAQCFHTLEFRHGPKAIAGPKTLITFMLSESATEAEAAVLREVKQFGATTLVVTNRANRASRDSADYLVEMSLAVPEAAGAAAFVIPAQLLGLHIGLGKGLDPDNPRHLSRVVMLESSGDGESGRGEV